MTDEQYMGRALALAALGVGRTAPNPAVGSVVVRDGAIVSEGWHHAAGQPHAEVEALRDAGDAAVGADIYVTLEPCCHWGRTGPCTEAIISAGIRRVIYACGDPDVRCAGQGEEALRAAGIEVRCGPLGQEARRLNEAYFKHKQTARPFVTLKLACTLDGKLATRTGDSRWVSGEAARERVHGLRNRSDAVMVGVGTVLCDDPQLTTRLRGPQSRDALRVVVDTQARTPAGARVLNPASSAACLIATGVRAPQERICALKAAGAEVVALPETAGLVSLPALMDELGRRNVMGLLCEGGAHLAAALVAEGLVDRLLLFYAPKLLGDAEALDPVLGLNIASMADALRLQIEDIERIGEDILVSAHPCSQA